MIEPLRIGRRTDQVMRSQLALEILLNASALVAALLVLRVGLLAFEITPRIWSGATVYGLTDPIVWPLTLLPGADRRLLGAASLPDVTAVAVLVLVPLFLVGRDPAA